MLSVRLSTVGSDQERTETNSRSYDMNEQDYQSRIDAIRWYHDFDFPHGLQARSRVHDADFHRRLWQFIETHLASIDFQGKRVLDIGCWDGYWSFYAERRGASQVLATDDVSQNWAEGEGLRLAKQLFGSQIMVDQRRSVYELAALGQTFDVILFLGVYYHLYDPYYAFTQIRHCCGPETIVVMEGDVGLNLAEGEARFCFTNTPAVSTFIPSIDTLDMMIKAAYMNVVSHAYFTPPSGTVSPPPSTVSPLRRWWKQSGVRKVWKSLPVHRARPQQREQRAADVVHVDRTLLVCKPFVGTNETHRYKPSFGLTAYDPRFSSPPA